MAIDFPEPKWAVPGLIAEGLNLLVGAPKLGKSWMALNLAVAIACGGTALDYAEVLPGSVLYLALEDTGRRLQDRLRRVLQGVPPPASLTLDTACEPLDAGGIEKIETWLRANLDARLVVIDVLTKVRGAVADRTNPYASDYNAMSPLKDLADGYNVAFLVLHHTRKGPADDFLDTVSGTQGLAGAADAVLVLNRSRGAADAVLHVTGRDIEESEIALKFEGAIGTWRLLDGPASDYALSPERRRILAVVRYREEMTPKEIAEASGVSYEVVRKLVRKMVTDGQLETDGAGRYQAVHPGHSVPTHLLLVTGVNDGNDDSP